MTSTNNSKSNFCFTKIIFILTIAFLFSTGIATTAYASEVNGTDTATDSQDIITISEDTITEGDTFEEGMILGEGYYVDEQGQIYYDETTIKVEELVIEDIPVEDTEEIDEEEDSKADVKDKTEPAKQETIPAVEKPSYSESDLRLLSSLIYAEAGNQSYKGMLAVANVVINRAKSDVYWHVNTIKEVIYDRKWSVQFSVTIKSSKTGTSALDRALKCYDTGKFNGGNPKAEEMAMARAIKAAKDALEGKNNIGDYLCFTYKNGTSSIRKKYPDYKIIGDHIFYRTK